jgi:hypothetical protein
VASKPDRLEAAAPVGEDRSGTGVRRSTAKRDARRFDYRIGLAECPASQPRPSAGRAAATTGRAAGSRPGERAAAASGPATQFSAPTNPDCAGCPGLAECSPPTCRCRCASRARTSGAEIGAPTASAPAPGASDETGTDSGHRGRGTCAGRIAPRRLGTAPGSEPGRCANDGRAGASA